MQLLQDRRPDHTYWQDTARYTARSQIFNKQRVRQKVSKSHLNFLNKSTGAQAMKRFFPAIRSAYSALPLMRRSHGSNTGQTPTTNGGGGVTSTPPHSLQFSVHTDSGQVHFGPVKELSQTQSDKSFKTTSPEIFSPSVGEPFSFKGVIADIKQTKDALVVLQKSLEYHDKFGLHLVSPHPGSSTVATLQAAMQASVPVHITSDGRHLSMNNLTRNGTAQSQQQVLSPSFMGSMHRGNKGIGR